MKYFWILFQGLGEKIVIFMFLLSALILIKSACAADLLLVGQANYVGSVSRHPLLFIDMLSDDLRISFKHTNEYKPYWIPEKIKKIIEAPLTADLPPVALLTDVVWLPGHPVYEHVPETFLKYAY